MSDNDILSSLTWPGSFDPPEQENDFVDLENGIEQLEINPNPVNLETMPDSASGGGRCSQTEDPCLQSADGVVHDIRVCSTQN